MTSWRSPFMAGYRLVREGRASINSSGGSPGSEQSLAAGWNSAPGGKLSGKSKERRETGTTAPGRCQEESFRGRSLSSRPRGLSWAAQSFTWKAIHQRSGLQRLPGLIAAEGVAKTNSDFRATPQDAALHPAAVLNIPSIQIAA